jgi:hypothetical protein
MDKARDSYSPEEFAAKLKSGKFDVPPLAITGMMKSSNKDGCLSFTRGGCDSWVDVPYTLIEKVEQLGWATCKDHAHPRVRIYLNSPHDADQEALVAMIRHLLTSRQRPLPVAAQRLTNRLRPSAARISRRSRRMNCDNEQLSYCLDDVLRDFKSCEEVCAEQYPDDSAGYGECRDECRGIQDAAHEDCYRQWCDT